MPSFNYSALDARGAEKSGRLDAMDMRQVTLLLREQGLFPVRVTQAMRGSVQGGEKSKKSGWLSHGLGFFRPVRPRELAAFTRQLGTLLRAGMPLLRSLEVLGRQEKNPSLRHVIGTLA